MFRSLLQESKHKKTEPWIGEVWGDSRKEADSEYILSVKMIIFADELEEEYEKVMQRLKQSSGWVGQNWQLMTWRGLIEDLKQEGIKCVFGKLSF